MRARALHWGLVGLFALTVGHLAWNATLGPPVQPNYFIGGGGKLPVLGGVDPEIKVQYFRRNYYLSQRPRHAWIKAVAYDELWLYVNGELVEEQDIDGFPVGVIADIAPFLQFGHNVIGCAVRQAKIGQPPIVHLEGMIDLDDGAHPIAVDSEWRCCDHFARRGDYWMSPNFDDRQWDKAVLGSMHLRSPVKFPPEAVIAPRRGHWLTPPFMTENVSSIRREFTIGHRPAASWLRILSTGSYRLAINGIVLDQQENQLGTTEPVPPVRRLYEVTPLLHSGKNWIALTLFGTGSVPHILLEMETTDNSGAQVQINSDADWLGHGGQPPDWLAAEPAHPDEWRSCAAEDGDLDIVPWQPRLQIMDLQLPLLFRVRSIAGELALIVVIGLATLLLTQKVASKLGQLRGGAASSKPAEVAYLALVPATLSIAGAILAVYDPQIGPQHVYRVEWLALALLTVPLQWLLLAVLAVSTQRFDRAARDVRREQAAKALGVCLVVMGLMATGFVLRIRQIDLEPLQWDEVEVYRSTVGMLQLGFPNYKAYPDQPTKFTETSELIFPTSSLVALFTDNDIWICRFPCVVWGTLMIGLIYWIGREMFSYTVGLIASTIYTFAPPCIAMSDFGRYFGQLEFMTMLTIYFFWLTVRGEGPINRKALWLTALSFICIYLTWECGALIAPSMMVAAILQRRGRLATILLEPQIWIAMLVVALVIGLQYSHRELQQTLYMWYGISVSDINLKPMWRYPTFKPLYYLWESSYSQDIFVPLLGFSAACIVAVRHRFHSAIRLVLTVHVLTALIMTCLLPAFAWRYAAYLVAPLILECSAAYGAIAWRIAKFARRTREPGGWRLYASTVAGLAVFLILVLGSGRTIRLIELPRQLAEGYGTVVFKFPNLGGPVEYLKKHWQPGDAICASDPQQIHHLLGWPEGEDRPDSYWPANKLFVPATLDDRRTLPIERRDGTKMMPSLKSLEETFARYERVWYLVSPDEHHRLNTPELSTYIRENMDLVYEDFESLVFLRDRNHRSPEMRTKNEQELSRAASNFLP